MLRLLLGVLLLASVAKPALARAGAACAGNDPRILPLPASLVPEAMGQFGLSAAPRSWVMQSTVIRCMGGKIWACNAGANLPCGKADTAATLPAGDDWCRQNPNSDFIPAYITGHDSIWTWRCVAQTPATTGKPARVDTQGYLSAYWKRLN